MFFKPKLKNEWIIVEARTCPNLLKNNMVFCVLIYFGQQWFGQ